MSPENYCVALENAFGAEGERRSGPESVRLFDLEQILLTEGVRPQVTLTIVELFRGAHDRAERALERAKEAESELEDREEEEGFQTKLGEVVYEMLNGLSKEDFSEALRRMEDFADEKKAETEGAK